MPEYAMMDILNDASSIKSIVSQEPEDHSPICFTDQYEQPGINTINNNQQQI